MIDLVSKVEVGDLLFVDYTGRDVINLFFAVEVRIMRSSCTKAEVELQVVRLKIGA